MFCNNCGNEIPTSSQFCPNCGKKCELISGTKMIQLKCNNCGGSLEVNSETQDVKCPFCGAVGRIPISDAVAVENIKKEVEFAKIANENEKQLKQEKKEERNAYRKGKLSKITIILIFICLFTTINSFKELHILRGLISLIQLGLFATSWLMGMQIIKEKRKLIYVALAILGFLLIIPYCMLSNINIKESKKLNWPTSGIATIIPNPNAKYGKVITNDNNRLYVDIDDYTYDEFVNYKSSCESNGFTTDIESSDSKFEAYNNDGYKLSLLFYSDSLTISLDAPISKGELKWPESEIAKLLPIPKSNLGKIEWESENGFVIYICETSIDDYNAYIEEVIKSGFDVDYHKTENAFYADNTAGYHVNISYEGNDTMFVRIDKPDEVPDNKTTDKENSDSEESDGNNETTINETENTNTENESSIVDPDLKAFLDSYEAFIDDYIEFMKKYNESSDTTSMLIDYTNMMTKYADFADKLDKYDTDTMSAADSAYYIEVTSRCSTKLLNASIE